VLFHCDENINVILYLILYFVESVRGGGLRGVLESKNANLFGPFLNNPNPMKIPQILQNPNSKRISVQKSKIQKSR
jgi:hypothetical protein